MSLSEVAKKISTKTDQYTKNSIASIATLYKFNVKAKGQDAINEALKLPIVLKKAGKIADRRKTSATIRVQKTYISSDATLYEPNCCKFPSGNKQPYDWCNDPNIHRMGYCEKHYKQCYTTYKSQKTPEQQAKDSVLRFRLGD